MAVRLILKARMLSGSNWELLSIIYKIFTFFTAHEEEWAVILCEALPRAPFEMTHIGRMSPGGVQEVFFVLLLGLPVSIVLPRGEA